MKIVQVINNAGQPNGSAIMWDSASNEVTSPQWAWPPSSNRNRLKDRIRSAGDVIGVRWQQRESDGNSFLDRQYVSAVGAVPGSIDLTTPPANTVPYYDGIVSWLGDKMFTVANRLGVYAAYDFTGAPGYVVGALGNFPYDVGGLSAFGYADGAIRVMSVDATAGIMYLSTPLDGSALNKAVTLPLVMAVNPNASAQQAIADGCAQQLRLLAAGTGVAVIGTAWQMYRYTASQYDARSQDDHSSLLPSLTGDSTAQFVDYDQSAGIDIAVTLKVGLNGNIKKTEIVPIQGVDVSLFSQWYMIGGVGSSPPVQNFWHNFVRAFEDLGTA